MAKTFGWKRALAGVALAGALAGCRTNKDILDDYERAFEAGNYAGPIAEVSKKADGGGGDALMWQLHAASANALAGNGPEAIRRYDLAEDAFLANDRQGVFSRAMDGTFAMMTNDRAFDFAGTGLDRVFTCFYKAVEFMCSGNVAAARTEFNRAAQHQDNWLWERRRERAEAEEQMRKGAAEYAKAKNVDTSSCESSVQGALADASFADYIRRGCGFDPQTDGRLEGLSRADYVNRYVEQADAAFRLLADKRPVGSTVFVFVEDGLAPCREEWRCDLPLVFIPFANRYIQYAGMALPKLRQRRAAAGTYTLTAGGAQVALSPVEDIDRLVKMEFDVYMRGALAREITRVVVKAGAQVALGIAADHTGNNNTKLALRLSQFTVAAWAASVTQADLRSWTALPKAVYAAQVPRPADGRLVLRGNGQPVAELELPPGNAMVFVRRPSAAAAAVVKVAKFP